MMRMVRLKTTKPCGGCAVPLTPDSKGVLFEGVLFCGVPCAMQTWAKQEDDLRAVVKPNTTEEQG